MDVVSREELYQLVWSEPIIKVAEWVRGVRHRRSIRTKNSLPAVYNIFHSTGPAGIIPSGHFFSPVPDVFPGRPFRISTGTA